MKSFVVVLIALLAVHGLSMLKRRPRKLSAAHSSIEDAKEEGGDLFADSMARKYEKFGQEVREQINRVKHNIADAKRSLDKAIEDKKQVDNAHFDTKIKRADNEVEELNANHTALHRLLEDTKRRINTYQEDDSEGDGPVSEMEEKVSGVQKVLEALHLDSEGKKNETENAERVYNDLSEKLKQSKRLLHLNTKIELKDEWKPFKKHSPIGFKLSRNGILHFQGIVTGGTVSFEKGTIFTLPSEYHHESSPVLFAAAKGTSGRIDVTDNGRIVASAPTRPAAPQWFSLDGLSMIHASLFVHPLKLEKPFKQSPTHPRLGYLFGREGVVYLQGVITVDDEKSLRISDHHEVLITQLPKDHRPSKWVTLAAMAENDLARIDVFPDGKVMVLFPLEASWFSLDGLSFMSEAADKAAGDIELKSGWTAFSEKHTQPKVLVTKDGIVQLSGVVKGDIPKGTEVLVGTLSEESWPLHDRVFKIIGDNRVLHLKITSKGQVRVVGEKEDVEWVSLDGISFYIGEDE